MGDVPYMFPFMRIVQAIYILMSFIKTQKSEKRDIFWIAFFAFVWVNWPVSAILTKSVMSLRTERRMKMG
jgi:hypothetical protein